MKKTPKLNSFQALGLTFQTGTFQEVFTYTLQHPILLAPSGPGLASLDKSKAYREALLAADLLLPDSGLLVLWKRLFSQDNLTRYSGYAFLKDFIENVDHSFLEKVLWVMPDQETLVATSEYLQKTRDLAHCHTYLAPWYEEEEISDPHLLEKIREDSPSAVILCIAGGKQEILAHYLRKSLSDCPPTYALGAAIAFLSGTQARITPVWDRLYLGWLVRILTNPKDYFPRYWKAIRLVKLLLSSSN